MFEYAPAPESRDIVDIQSSYGLFIGGEFVDAATSFKTVNPASEEVLAEVAEADAGDVDRAVAAARAAYDGVWSKMPGGRARQVHLPHRTDHRRAVARAGRTGVDRQRQADP